MGRKRRHTDEQIIHKLREAEVALAQGKTTKDVCKQLEVTEQTYYRWRKEYGGLKVDQAKRLPIVLFGTESWDKVINLEPMVEYGTISPEDVNLFYRTDSVDDAYAYLVKELEMHALKKPATGSYLAG
jgi:transposase-like protein